jgi:hypothetical protein
MQGEEDANIQRGSVDPLLKQGAFPTIPIPLPGSGGRRQGGRPRPADPVEPVVGPTPPAEPEEILGDPPGELDAEDDLGIAVDPRAVFAYGGLVAEADDGSRGGLPPPRPTPGYPGEGHEDRSGDQEDDDRELCHGDEQSAT